MDRLPTGPDGENSTASLQRVLLALALSVTGLVIVWGAAGHFRFQLGAYLDVGLLSLALFLGSAFYRYRRPDPRLAAMLFGAGFLCLFSAAASALNYCLLTIAGNRIDSQLAAIDRALGFDWPVAMAAMAGHPILDRVLLIAYASMLPQVALLMILLARRHSYPLVYRFCLAVAVSALTCIALWTLAPSFGAFSVYALPAAAAHLPLALDRNYADALVPLLRQGPDIISPTDAKGLIGFPSYHAALALLVIAYAWTMPALRWPALILNLTVLISTPLQGGHHLIDVLAAFPVAAMALFLAAGKGFPWPRSSFDIAARPSGHAGPPYGGADSDGLPLPS
jgi:hypothetical protein